MTRETPLQKAKRLLRWCDSESGEEKEMAKYGEYRAMRRHVAAWKWWRRLSQKEEPFVFTAKELVLAPNDLLRKFCEAAAQAEAARLEKEAERFLQMGYRPNQLTIVRRPNVPDEVMPKSWLPK